METRPKAVSFDNEPSKPVPSASSERRGIGRWLQTLAAVLLTCLIVSGFVLIQVIHHLGTTTTAAQAPLKWCISSGAQTSQSLNDSSLSDIVAISANDVWAVGSHLIKTSVSAQFVPLMEHWTGAHWSMVPLASPESSIHYVSLKAISAASAHDIWAVGSMAPQFNPVGGSIQGQRPLLEHWNGLRWVIVPTPDLTPQGNSELVSVVTLSATDAWAVGSTAVTTNGALPLHYTPLALHWDGRNWTQTQLPAGFVPGDLNKITEIGRAHV